MDHDAAVQFLRSISVDDRPLRIQWLSPVMTALLAALSARDSEVRRNIATRLLLADNQQSYANNCGLTAILEGGYESPRATGLQGKTYSRVTRLNSVHEVDACNAIINELFHEVFGGLDSLFARMLAKVVGELHDNVASHASGMGFSSAQRYRRQEGDVIQFAIADCGVGMLRNVHRKLPEIETDEEAIAWCLGRGHTTAGTDGDGWAQRLPDDSLFNPYPPTVQTRTGENHHQGLGLWHLREIVQTAGGGFWVASGQAQCRYLAHSESPVYDPLSPRWTGVAIDVELPIPRAAAPTPAQRAGLERLAERLGL